MLKRLAAALVLLASVILLGGCVAISGVSSAQQDVVGKLRLTVTVCKVDHASFLGLDHPGCDIPSNGGEASTNSIAAQVLVAFRLPSGSDAPATVIGTTNDASSSALSFARSPTYEAELTRLLPPPNGAKWVGYLSDAYSYDGGADGTAARQVSVPVDLTLPRPTDGSPYVGPLAIRPVVGARDIAATRPADRDVTCGGSAFAPDTSNTICIDNPMEAQIGANLSFATRDFGVLSGNATASRGQSVALPFNIRGAGALPAGLIATLSATTTLAGASVAPSLSSAALANGSDTRVTVPVAIPANAPAGVYDVALTGRLDNGQERTGVAKLTVRAKPPVPDVAKPRLTAARVKPKAFRAATKKKPKRGTRVSFSLNEAANVRVVVERCSKRAKPKGKRRGKGRCARFKAMRGALTKTGKAGANSFRFDGRVRGKPLKPGLYRLALTPTDPAANAGVKVRAPFTILR